MNSVYSLLLMFIVLFISDDTVMFGTNMNQSFAVIRYQAYAIVLMLLVFQPTVAACAGRARWRNLVIAVVMALAFAATMVMNGDVRNGYFLEALVLLLAGLIALRVERRVFLSQFSQVLFWFAVFSLCIFPLSIFATPLLELLPVTENYAGVEFINLGLAMIFRDPDIIRNTAIFREPGVFALYLLTGLMVELFYMPRPRSTDVAVFLVALATTMSTTGYFVGCLLLSGHILRKNIGNALLVSMLMMVLAVGVIYVWPEIIHFIFSKFDEDSNEFASALARLSSISVPFSIFQSNPVFGAGLTRFVDQYLLFSEQLFGFPINPDGASTNTILNMFAIYGTVLGLLTVGGLFKFTWSLTRNRLARLTSFIALLMMFSSQELRFSVFFNCLIMYGLFNSVDRELEQ
jgi:O-Antigen ligase